MSTPKMPKMHSAFDTRGHLYVDCSECERGGNGSDMDKCSCGWKTRRPKRGGCFVGTPMAKYRDEIDAAKLRLGNHTQ